MDIREGLEDVLETHEVYHNKAIVEAILTFLNDNGVVRKVEGDWPSIYTELGNLKYGGMILQDIKEAGYTLTEKI